MISRYFVLLILLSLLVSCAETPVIPKQAFQLEGRAHLYERTSWSLAGRLALSDESQSLTATINWNHQREVDEIELAGPFGRGRTFITLTKQTVLIDDGDKQHYHHQNADQYITNYIGIQFPVMALKHWVFGLPDPDTSYVLVENGFIQSGWVIRYLQMQWVKEDQLPRKINITKNNSKLKLIINQWDL